MHFIIFCLKLILQIPLIVIFVETFSKLFIYFVIVKPIWEDFILIILNTYSINFKFWKKIFEVFSFLTYCISVSK